MQFMKGELKLQYGSLYVHEMKESAGPRVENANDVTGYAIFDSNHQRIGNIFKFYHQAMAEAERNSAIGYVQEFLRAA